MDNFRDSYFKVDWDLTSKRLRGTYWGKQYDTGRGFAVTVINGGQVVAPTTEVLRLKWEKPDNTTGYVNATIVNGKFIVENIDQMFTVHGSVRADFELSVGGEFVASITFYVNVEKAVAIDSIESSSEFTALQEAITTIDGIDEIKSQVVQIERQLEDGTAGIDDSVISDNKVWSSSKTQQEIQLIPKGEHGFSAYELWLNEGNEGTIDDFYRNALRFFFLETEPTNPQEGDVWFRIPTIELIDDYFFRFDAMSLGLNDGEQVATWTDLSENGNSLVATNSIYRPIFSSTGFKGKPTVEFVESHLDINPFLLDKNDGVTMFIVGKFDDVSSSSSTPLMIGTKTPNTIDDPVVQVRMSSSSKTITTTVNDISSTTLTADLNEFVYTHTCDMTTQKVWKNGVLIPSSPYTGGALGTHNTLRVGTRATTGVDQFKGKISEIIYFSRALSDTEISEMNAYLMNKWGV